MKKIIYTFSVLSLIATASFAQVKVNNVKHNILAVGSANVALETISTIRDMRYIQQKDQLVLISSKDTVNIIYYVYSSTNQLIVKGTFKKSKAGEYTLINLGSTINDNYTVVLIPKTNTPLVAITQ